MRCFVAAWPDQATREALQRQIEAVGTFVGSARATQPRNLHLTLAFIGELDAVTAGRVARTFSERPADKWEWTIDALGWFPRARVAWAGGRPGTSLASEVARVGGQLDGLGVPYDRKPFVAHVTLFRDVRAFQCSGPIAEPILWLTEQVALYAASRDMHGPVYRRVDSLD